MRRGSVKGKPGAGINLFFTKITNGVARLNVPIRWTNRYQQYIVGRTMRLRLEEEPLHREL